jgi:protein-tyrosine phosphatase
MPSILESNNALAEPVQIPGLDYLEINIIGKGFERSMLWAMSWWSLMLVYFSLVGSSQIRVVRCVDKKIPS